MISPAEARRLILEHIAPLQSESVAHENALGRVLARDVFADLDLPPFDNSAVDGYAARAQDIQNVPHDLRVLGTIAAGATPIEYSLGENQAARIMTGAPIPFGADCVVMREDTAENDDTNESDDTVQVLESARSGVNIRRRGSDVCRGERVLEAGTRVRAAQWAMLASLGQAHVAVFRRPRVGVLTTGNELRRVDEEIGAGEIRDSNSFALRALVEECGAVVARQKTVGDDAREVETVLQEMFASCDAIVSSGGVSMGDFDVIRDVLPQIAQLHFWKIAVKPGKPVMFATRIDNARTIPIWGLPGNPVSVMVSFEQFVRPALLRIGGQNNAPRVELQVRVLDALSSPSGKVEYVRALVNDVDGDWTARINGDQGSGRLSTMTNANALLVVPADVTRVDIGETLTAQMLMS